MASIYSAMNVARTGLQLQEFNIAVKAQNLSSQGVDAYKRQYLVAEDLPYEDLRVPGAESAAGTVFSANLQFGLGVRPGGVYRVFTQGDMVETGKTLDMGIQGEGFFKIIMPDGSIAFTRASSFERSGTTGQMVTIPAGYTLSPGINIPIEAKGISISEDGQIVIETDDNGNVQNIGQIELATFFNPSGLRAIGQNLYKETTASGTATTGTPGSANRGKIKQGWKEGSNVQPVEEITDLIKIQRAYEMITRVVNTADSMADTSTKMGGGR